jgi:hypothetical protein
VNGGRHALRQQRLVTDNAERCRQPAEIVGVRGELDDPVEQYFTRSFLPVSRGDGARPTT